MAQSFHTSSKTATKMAKEKQQRRIDALNRSIKTGIIETEKIAKEERNSQIALFDAANFSKEARNIYDPERTLSIFKAYNGNKNPLFASDEKVAMPIMEKFYKNNFFDNLKTLENLKKSETGVDLITNVREAAGKISYNLSSQKDSSSFSGLLDAGKRLEHVKKYGGVILDFDIESLGGVNAAGHQQIDSITEISAKAMKIIPGQNSQVVEDMTTLLGYSEGEYSSTKKYLESLRSKLPGELTSKDRVYLNRFSRIADPNISLDYGDGFDIKIADTSKAVSDKDLVVNVDNALAGLKRQREIGIRQEDWIGRQQTLGNLSNTYDLEGYKKKYIRDVQDLVLNGVGKNGVYEDAVAVGHNIINFDIVNMARISGYNIANPKVSIFDSYQYVKYLEEILGQGTHYNRTKALNNVNPETKLYGSGTQDFLRTLNGTGTGQAHNAGVDVDNHFKLIMDSEFGNNINKNLSKMHNKAGALKGEYVQEGRKGIFYNGPTLNEGWGNKNNSLNFVYDPLNNSFKSYGGYSVNMDTGKVTKEDFGAWGPKANALYEKSIYEVDFTSNWKEALKEAGMDDVAADKFFQNYSGSTNAYIIQSREYIDEKRLGGAGKEVYKEGKTYYEIITDREKVAPALGLKVGYKNEDGSFAPKMDSIEALELKQMSTNAAGELEVKSLQGQDAVEAMLERHTHRVTKDSAARTIRDGSYTRFQTHRKFQQQNGISLAEVVSKAVSENRPLTMDITTPLIQELGYTVNGKRKITPERLTKATAIDEYVQKGEKVFGIMEELFQQKGMNEAYNISKGNYTVFDKIAGQGSEYAKRDFIFKQTLNNVFESLSDNPAAISGGVPTTMTRFESNKIDFNMYDIFPEMNKKRLRGNVANQSSDILSINLSGNDSLIRAFSKGKFNGVDVIPHSNAAYQSLVDAYEAIGADERFQGVWDGFGRQKLEELRHGNLSILNDEMVRRVQSFTDKQRSVNPAFGYMTPRTAQDPAKMWDLLLGKSEDEIRQLFTENYANVNDFQYLSNAAESNSAINQIVDNYFMTFKEDALEEQIKGLTPRQQDIMRSNYKLAKDDATARAAELLKASKEGGVDLVMSGEDLFMMKDGELGKVNSYKYTLTNGVIETRIGDNHYAVNHAYNVSDMYKNGRRVGGGNNGLKIKVTNNIQNNLDNMTSLVDVAKRQDRSEKSIIENLTYQIGRRNQIIAQNSPRREVFNYTNTILRSTTVDTNGLVTILPELKDAGIIDDIIKLTGMDEKYAGNFKEAIEKMRGMDRRYMGVSDMFSNEKSLFLQLFDPTLTEFIKPDFKDEVTEKVFKTINSYTKNTSHVDGTKQLDLAMAHGAASWDKTTRPPVYQYGNTEMYDAAEIADKIAHNKTVGNAKQIFENIYERSIVTTSAAEKYMYNLDINGSTKTSGLTMKYLQANSTDLRNYVTNSKNNAEGMNYLKKAFKNQKAGEIVLDRVKELSTYEQQTIMNSRVFDTAFHRNNKQVIAKKKQLLLEHDETVKALEEMKASASDLYPVVNRDGTIRYMPGAEVKANQMLGAFGLDDAEKIKAKHDGIFRSRYYKDGHMLSEKELNDFIKRQKGINLKDPEDIINALERNFDRRFEVVNKFQDHGQKVFNETSEKSTTTTLAMQVGSLDETVSKRLIDEGYGDTVGKVLSKEYEDFILNKINDESFTKRYLTEKHALSDFMAKVKGLEDVGQFVALDSFKHNSTSLAISDGLNKLSKEGLLEDDQLDALFGQGKWVKNDNGSINFDNIKEINPKALLSVGTEEEGKALFNLFTNVQEEDFIKGLGHKGFSHVVQMRDDAAGTYAGDYLDAGAKDIKDRFKGIKFSKTMNVTLGADKFDKDSFGLAQKRYASLGLEEEFNKAFKFAMKDGVLDENLVGKSILEPALERLHSTLLKTPGQEILSETQDPRYDYLKRQWGANAANISVDNAENVFSYSQGVQALSFNNKFSGTEYRNMINNPNADLRFDLVDLSKARPGVADDWLSLDIGGQGDTVTSALNNPYSQNLMIKYGPNSDDVLAIARMPERHFDDSLIKKDHIKKLNSLQENIKALNAGNFSSQEERQRLESTINSIVGDIKTLQKKDLTSKKGLMGDLTSVRLDQSFIGKGSGITINDSNVTSLRQVAGTSKEEAKARLSELIKNNASSLSDAKFNGKSLLEHYSEGKAIDSVFMSREAFENMGYFNETYMDKVFNNMEDSFGGGMKARYLEANNNLVGKQKVMEDLLSQYGDSFIGVRYPEIMEGSDKMVMGYLNSNLKGNQMQVVGHTGASMKLDHDGDQVAVTRAKNINNESMLDYTVNSKAGDKKLVDFADSLNANMMKRATNENWYWDDQVREQLKKEAKVANEKIASGSSMIDAVGAKTKIDGKLVSSMLDLENTTISEYQGLRNKYVDLLSLGDHEKAVDQIKASQDLTVEEYSKAYAYQAYTDEIIAKSSNQAIGEINATNAKIKTAFSALMDPTQDDYKYNQITSFDLFHASEEAAISAKSSIEGLTPNRAKEWNDMATKLIMGEGDSQELVSGMKSWLESNTFKDLKFEQYFDASENFQNKAAELLGTGPLDKDTFVSLINKETTEGAANRLKLGRMVGEDFVDNISSLSNVENVGKFLNQLSLGQSTAGVIRGTDSLVTAEGFTSPYNSVVEAINMTEDLGKDIRNINIVEKARKQSFIGASETASEILSSAERNTGKKSLSHAILEGAGDLFQGVKSSGMAAAAIGIAAGIMAVGFVGGRPRPADVHAMEEAQDMQAPIGGGSVLADPGLMAQQGTGQGYVVNINARTNKSRENAISAIQHAITSGGSSNVNVSMNISDNYGNITDRDLERAMADVLR